MVFAVLALMLITGSGFFGGHHGAADLGWQVPDIPAAAGPRTLRAATKRPGTTDARTTPTLRSLRRARPEAAEEDALLAHSNATTAVMLVPESEAVDDSYFDDAVFIGNSRTVGLKMYSGLTNATFITEVGLTVDSIFTDYCDISGGGKARAFDQLAGMEFSKVYIMLGMNRLGWVYESVFKGGLRQDNRQDPRDKPGRRHLYPVHHPGQQMEGLQRRGLHHRQREPPEHPAARPGGREEVHYVDVAEGVMDDEGYLPFGGHGRRRTLTPEYCVVWMDYLRTHTAQ